MIRSIASPHVPSQLLGAAGIVGGAVLLAAFAVDVGPDLNNVRLALFCLGAIAVVVGVHRLQSPLAPPLALSVAAPAVLANAWFLAMVVVSIGSPYPFAGINGAVLFAAGAAMWLADAAFGLATWRLGVVARWGALALAVGSLLAITGMDRLQLTTPDNPTIFMPLSQIGIALNGLGWILLGLEVATRRPPTPA